MIGAKSKKLDSQVPDEIKKDRWHRLMQLQKEISEDEIIGRSYADAPEIDGAVYVYSDRQVEVGEIAQVSIEEATEYDLIGYEV